MSTNAVVGRLPVLDRSQAIAGYQLLFRSVVSSAPPPGPSRSAAVSLGPYIDQLGIDVDRIASGRTVYFPADRAALTGQRGMVPPVRDTVLTMAPGMVVDDEVISGCRALQRAGFRIAAPTTQPAHVLDIVDIVTVDLRFAATDDLTALAALGRTHHAEVLGTHIAGTEQHLRCEEAGFDLFQGHVGRGTALRSPALNPAQRNVLNLAGAVLSSDTDFDGIERIVRTDPALTYQLIHLASLGRFGEARREVRSIREALVLMGEQRLRGWIPALLLRPAGRAVDTHLVTALARARAVELIAETSDGWDAMPLDSAAAFTAGLLSAFDLLLPIPREELASTLDLPPALREDAFGTVSDIAQVIRRVTEVESDDDADRATDPNTVRVNTFAAEAFGWAMQAATAIDDVADPAR